MIKPAEVLKLLEAERIQLLDRKEAVSDNVWAAFFDVEGKKQMVFLLLPPEGGEYMFMIAMLQSSSLFGKTLDELPADVLRTMLRVSSEVDLAKVIYQPSPPAYLVTSECSTEGVTGPKLRRRLHACARLAAKLELALV